jgi:hypothetical protein
MSFFAPEPSASVVGDEKEKKTKTKRIHQSPSLEYLKSGGKNDDEGRTGSLQRIRPTREALSIESGKVFTSLSSNERDAIVLALFETAYEDAYKARGSKQLN